MHFRAHFRLLGMRAGALGAVATAFGVLGHVHAGGAAPSTAQIVAVWLAASGASVAFLMREVGWLRIIALLLTEQILIHMGLMRMVGMPAMPAMPAMPSMPGMPMPSMSGMPGMSGMGGMGIVPSGQMLAAHLVAAVIAGLWLWRGERALCTLIVLASASLLLLRRRFVVPSVALPDVWVATDLRPLWGLRVAREARRRGPPLPAVQ